jgi:hypothetical protein
LKTWSARLEQLRIDRVNHDDHTRDELFIDPDEVVTFAQAYYATEFPNDGRSGCPPGETLRATARSGIPPDGRLRSHLFGCSECFRSYRSARMSQCTQSVTAESPWHRLNAVLARPRPLPVMMAVGVCGVVLFGAIGATFLWLLSKYHPALAVNYPLQVEVIQSQLPQVTTDDHRTAAVVKRIAPQPGRTTVARKVQPRLPKETARIPRTSSALPVVEINLKEDNLLRDGDETEVRQHIIILSPKRQRLRLRMPRGSAAGRYTVRIVDAFGKPRLSTAANSDGRTLAVDLDLRGLNAKTYRLCLARDGEAPDCFLLSVGE